MGKLGRIRKYSHRRYKTTKTKKKADDDVSPRCGWFADIPYKFQYHLRSLNDSDKPSIESFTQIFTILEKENAFIQQWNLIKHCESFLMLCNFSTENNIAPAAKRTVIVNTDLTWNVIIGHKAMANEETAIPKILRNAGDFVYLFDMVDTSVVCTGICDEALVGLANSGSRHGIFKDWHGNVKGQLLDDNTIRPSNCSGIVHGGTSALCAGCKSYRHSLFAILSKERNSFKRNALTVNYQRKPVEPK